MSFLALLQVQNVKRLAITSLLTTIVMAAGKVMALATGIVLARLLGPEGYGIYSFSMAVLGILAVFACLGLPQYLVRMIATYRANKHWGLFGGLLVQANFSVVIFATVVASIGAVVILLLGLESERETSLLWALALLPIVSLSSIRRGVFEGLEYVALAKFFEEVLRPFFFLIMIFIVWQDGVIFLDVARLMQVQFAAFTLTLIVGSWMLWRRLPLVISQVPREYQTKSWLKNAAPFFWLSGTGVLMSYTDIVMLGLMRPEVEVGLYRVASQVALLTGFFLTMAGSVASPTLAALYAQGNVAALQRIIRVFSLMSFGIALLFFTLFAFWGELFMVSVFGPQYDQSWWPSMILSFGFLMSSLFGIAGVALNMLGDAHLTARIFSVGVIVNVVLNAVFIPFYGYVGAAIAFTLTTIGWKLVASIFLYQRHKLGLFASGARI